MSQSAVHCISCPREILDESVVWSHGLLDVLERALDRGVGEIKARSFHVPPERTICVFVGWVWRRLEEVRAKSSRKRLRLSIVECDIVSDLDKDLGELSVRSIAPAARDANQIAPVRSSSLGRATKELIYVRPQRLLSELLDQTEQLSNQRD